MQPDGRILASCTGIASGGFNRINLDGSVGTGFNNANDRGFYISIDGGVDCMAVQADSKVLIGGHFWHVGGEARQGIARLNADGTLDGGFDAQCDGTVDDVVLQANGKLFVTGSFKHLGGQSCTNFGRLNPDGTLDSTFAPPSYYSVKFLLLDSMGNLLFESGLVTNGNNVVHYITRLHNTESATQSLSYTNYTVTWMRGGAGPEVWGTRFAWCTNGTDWVDLGAGTRIEGGWQFTNAWIPSGCMLRARGYIDSQQGTAGSDGTAHWYVQAEIGPLSVSPWANEFREPAVDVSSLALQGDNKILAAQSPGLSGPTVVRFLPNGMPDDSLVSNGLASESQPQRLSVQEDGAILVAGNITLAGQHTTTRQFLRLNPDGSLDSSFHYQCFGPDWSALLSVIPLPDGKILLNSDQRKVERLNPDGSPDPTFNCDLGGVLAMTMQSDGKIIVLCSLGIARVNPDGSTDSSFQITPTGGWPQCLVVQADGKILVAGGPIGLSSLGGQPRAGIGRLNPDGSVDATFQPEFGGGGSLIKEIVLQADGKIFVIGGSLIGAPLTLGGQACGPVVRLNPDGTRDTTFPGVPDTVVDCLLLDSQGNLVYVNGPFVCSIVRMHNTALATQSLTYNGSTITWLRGGTSPEVCTTRFAYSTDGTNYTDLGPGTRSSGGWDLAGVSLPAKYVLRARGYTTAGTGITTQCPGHGGWYLQTSIQSPAPTQRPQILTSDSDFGLSTGHLGFSVGGTPGQKLVIEVSTDLQHWTGISTNVMNSDRLEFRDTEDATLPCRFYRVRSEP